MMRWWDNEVFIKKRTNSENEILTMKGELIQEEDQKMKDEMKGLRRHTFRVEAETYNLERVAVTGNCPELGSWEANKLFFLDREYKSSVWSNTVALDSNKDIRYRYVIIVDDSLSPDFVREKRPTVRSKSVRRWEATEETRLLNPIQGISVMSSTRREYFKMSPTEVRKLKQTRNDQYRETLEEFKHADAVPGWLTSDIALHIKLFTGNIEFFDQKFENRAVYMKLRTISIVPGCSTNVDYYDDAFEGWPVVEISVLNRARRKFSQQSEYGTPICSTDNLIFQVNADSFDKIGIVVDFYYFESKDDAKPLHFGFLCLHPCKIEDAEGQVSTEICNIRDETIGQVRLSYIFIHPSHLMRFKFHHSLTALWSKLWFGRERYTGKKINHVKRCIEIRDNTVASVEESVSKAVQYVEITVQFSKDGVPVFGHSPYIVVALKDANETFPMEHFQICVSDLTAVELQKLSILPVNRCNNFLKLNQKTYPPDEKNRPFPSLIQLLNGVDKNVGFVVEFTSMSQYEDGSFPLQHDFDLNLYLDLLLKTVVQSAGRRNIILASFHPDVCSMMKLKQNIFPVLFLQNGVPGKYSAFHPDPRCNDLSRAIDFAVSMNLCGIGVTEKTILDSDNAWKIQKDYLIAYCVDEPENLTQLTNHFDKYRLSGIICSRRDKYGAFRRNLEYLTVPTDKERQYILNCSELVSKDGRLKPEIYPLEYPNSTLMELDALRNPDPTQIAPDFSCRTVLDSQRRDEDYPKIYPPFTHLKAASY